MLRIIRFLVCLLGTYGAAMALAQTPNPLPVQGNLTSIIGSGQSYAGVSIQLQNCPSPASITGFSVIVQQGYIVQANGAGLINTSVWPNDLITCNGTTGNSQYQVTYTANGAVQGTPQCYQVVSTQGTWNLNTQQPIACSQTPPNLQDATYRNLNSSGFFQGNNGAMSGGFAVGGALSAASVTDAGLISNVGKCVQVGTGGILGASSSACSTPTGITALTGDVTAAGTGSVTATLATANSAPGTCGDSTHVCSVTVDAKGRTTAQSPVAISGTTGRVVVPVAPGPVYYVDATTSRVATKTDLSTVFGYLPLNPYNDLSDVDVPYQALTNLFSGAGLLNVQVLGTTSGGLPAPVTIGGGLTYTNSVGVGSVTTFLITSIGTYTNCPSITFTGGGGTGATGFINCGINPHIPYVISMDPVITSNGSGYSSPPSVVFDTTYGSGGAATALLGAAGRLATSWQSGTFYRVAGTALPSCASTLILQRLAVSDATSATPGTTYAGGGSYTVPVECIFNATGSVYSWIVD